MSHLSDTHPFKVETGDALTYNVQPLLYEIRHALQTLLDSGEGTVIDLRSLPLAPGELEKIETTLGNGEVNAVLDAMGPSEIRETVYPGVWLVTHFNYDKQVMGKFIEITHVPSLLLSQDEDIADGLQQLDEQLTNMF
jgi:hydrogenase-1 operon protein HyaF